jgi:hypothetical protein
MVAEKHGVAKLLSSWWKVRDGKGLGRRCIFPGSASSDVLSPIKPYLLVFHHLLPPSYDSIKGLIH